MALTDDKMTHYLKSLNKEVVSMSKKVDLVDVSGDSVEAMNQSRKKEKTSRGGGNRKRSSKKAKVARDGSAASVAAGVTTVVKGDDTIPFIAKQLATHEVTGEYVRRRVPIPESWYRRSKYERQGTQLEAKTVANNPIERKQHSVAGFKSKI